jgi:hypothetical protein
MKRSVSSLFYTPHVGCKSSLEAISLEVHPTYGPMLFDRASVIINLHRMLGLCYLSNYLSVVINGLHKMSESSLLYVFMRNG